MQREKRGTTSTGRKPVVLNQAESFADLIIQRMGGMTQAVAAKEIGVSQGRVSRWLTRGAVPDREKLGQVADWMGISETSLYAFIREHHGRGPERSTTERLESLEARWAEMERNQQKMLEAIRDLRNLIK